MNKTRILIITLALCWIAIATFVSADSIAVSGITVDSIIQDSVEVASLTTTDEIPASSALYPMSAERKAKMASYSSFKSMWRFVEFFLGLATLSILLFTGLSARFRNWAKKLGPKFFVLWGMVALILLADYILNLPFHIYRSFIVENDYGFMNQTFIEWFSEDLLGLALGLIFAVIPAWFLYDLINKTRKWWLYFSLGSIPFVVLLIVLVPVFIMPMFNKFEPLEDKVLEQKLLTLAESVGIENPDLFQVNASKQTTKVNAYVTGMFGSKRIVLTDNIIHNFTHEEIEFVMGHEMGHYVMNHMWHGLAMAIAFLMFCFWITSRTIGGVITKFKARFKFESLGDIASLPLILIFISVLSFIGQPITNGFSRYNEHQSDVYGMEVTTVSGEAAATAFDKLSVFNLSDPDPGDLAEFWFYSHPMIKKRIEFVRSYRR